MAEAYGVLHLVPAGRHLEQNTETQHKKDFHEVLFIYHASCFHPDF